jgi:hypothetical protein
VCEIKKAKKEQKQRREEERKRFKYSIESFVYDTRENLVWGLVIVRHTTKSKRSREKKNSELFWLKKESREKSRVWM